ncbi:uncharacterized protein LOC112030593 [Quercus suber]|uniref:uncharacterized protein LOC112030593 n=1 Tax=Quercus suber TaxID=58331 RepID=UPI0032DF2C72
MACSESEEPAIPNMTTISRHNFSDDTAEPVFSISIIENMKEEYGLFVWPCSIVLAEYVWQQRLRFSGSSVVELGAGTCLPGLVAAKVGADVTLTDDANSIEVIDFQCNYRHYLHTIVFLIFNFQFSLITPNTDIWDKIFVEK